MPGKQNKFILFRRQQRQHDSTTFAQINLLARQEENIKRQLRLLFNSTKIVENLTQNYQKEDLTLPKLE